MNTFFEKHATRYILETKKNEGKRKRVVGERLSIGGGKEAGSSIRH